MDETTRQIRSRIFWLVLRAFLSVLLLADFVIILGSALALTQNKEISPFTRLPIISKLEGFYSANSSWNNVDKLLSSNKSLPDLILLDAENRLVWKGSQNASLETGQIIPIAPEDLQIPLNEGGKHIGVVIFKHGSIPSQYLLALTLLAPVTLLAIFLALLASVLIILLSRRIVNPLADVIAAAHAVTDGKLETRVQVQGTHDLRVLTDSFNQMAASIERNDRERRDLLADIAHELRTPISVIRGRLEGILDGVYPVDKKHISMALNANYLLERLVEDLRTLTLAESHQLVFERKQIDLRDLVQRSLEMFSAEASEKRITLEPIPENEVICLNLDPLRTEQAVGNLIGNAIRYTPEGGRIWLKLACDETTVHLTVCDSGPGVSEEDLPFIFTRFWRKDKSRSRNSGGSGLGLAISRQLIEMQGGTISAAQQPEGGLAITIHFPRLIT